MNISIPKGHDTLKPHTLVLNHITDIIPIIDRNRLHPSITTVLDDPTGFYTRIADICHVRVPIIKNSSINGIPLHAGVISYELDDEYQPLAQFIMFKGVVQTFISTAYTLGLDLGAVTSMNYKTNPTITSVKDALSFIEQNQVDTFCLPTQRKNPTFF
jgi:hypothetical protein